MYDQVALSKYFCYYILIKYFARLPDSLTKVMLFSKYPEDTSNLSSSVKDLYWTLPISFILDCCNKVEGIGKYYPFVEDK